MAARMGLGHSHWWKNTLAKVANHINCYDQIPLT